MVTLIIIYNKLKQCLVDFMKIQGVSVLCRIPICVPNIMLAMFVVYTFSDYKIFSQRIGCFLLNISKFKGNFS